jgi:hypothetical protein
MITDQRIQQLISLGNENRNLDYKGSFSWLAVGRDEKVGIAKDVLAFANTRDGGVILVGVDDKTGLLRGLTEDQFASFDQTRFNDFIHSYTEPKHTCFVCRREIGGSRIVAVVIPEFAEVPILCKQSVQSVTNPREVLLRKAGLYKRTDKATSELIEDADELRELLNRGLLRRQDELLAAMSRILQPQGEAKLSDDDSVFRREREEAADFFEEVGDGALLKAPHWELQLRPSRYIADRINDLSKIQRIVRSSAVSLRGWNFPHVNAREFSNFNSGFQTATDWKDSPFGRYLEAFRAYQSGFFIWRGTLWEDRSRDSEGRNVLSFPGVIFSVTEWMTFAKRYYESFLAVEEVLRVTIDLHGSKDRYLIATYPALPIPYEHRANVEPLTVSGAVEILELRSDSTQTARRFIKRVFELFNWNEVRDGMVQDWQRGLIENRFT